MIRNVDLVLPVLSSAHQLVSPVQLQNAAFLIVEKELEGLEGVDFEFEAYHYGPFNEDVYEESRRLDQKGLASRVARVGSIQTDTLVSPEGSSAAAALREALPPATVEKIDKIVEVVMAMTFRQLLRYVYGKYPEYREKSIFKY